MAHDLGEVASELRSARRAAGLTQSDVAAALGISLATVWRHEQGVRGAHLQVLARHAAVVGLRAKLKVYPGDDPIRDVAQVRLIRRFRDRLGAVGAWSFEVPIPHPFDRRALDAVLSLPGGRVGFEFYTRLSDAQAQLRAANLKRRDAELDRMIVVVQDTHANRRALRTAGDVLMASFPATRRATMTSLQAGEVPSADGVLIV